MLVLQKDLNRFWNKVNKTNNCWLWTSAMSKGYGLFTFDGKTRRAHIISYQLHNDDYDNNKCVCHHCDNPTCVNPNHLFLGSVQDNTNDKVSKGRASGGSSKGESHPQAILTKPNVVDIKRRLAAGEKISSIILDYPNVAQGTLWNIKYGKSWKDT